VNERPGQGLGLTSHREALSFADYVQNRPDGRDFLQTHLTYNSNGVRSKTNGGGGLSAKESRRNADEKLGVGATATQQISRGDCRTTMLELGPDMLQKLRKPDSKI
jgi:hypothetical protein